MLYNAACSEALNGKAADAASLLHRADTAAVQVVTDDGGGQEELMEETAIIKFVYYLFIHVINFTQQSHSQ